MLFRSGPNGVGKSTLLRIIAGVLDADAGTVTLGHEAQLGYFAQDHHEQLSGRDTAYEWLCGAGGSSDIPTVRGMLGRVLFTGDEADKHIDDLSGGEAARLLLAALMMRKPNLMLLDEPTNHLDLEGREALAQALRAYPGTLLFVSHDRNFVDEVGTRVLAVSTEGVEDFGGGYEAYLRAHGEDYLDAASAVAARRTAAGTSAEVSPASYSERKDARRNLAALRRSVERLEAEVAELEAELGRIEAAFAAPDYFMQAGRGQLERDSARREQVQRRLGEAIAEWEAAAADLETLAPA